jgi:RNA polymerase sigma-70 factor (ECF subfamily)
MFLRNHTDPGTEDDALVAQVRDGRSAAMGQLWNRYAHLLFGVAMKYLKEPEAAKDEVLGLFAELPVLLRRHEVKAFRPWVHTVMRNRCLMVLRKAGTPNLPIEQVQLEGEAPDEAAILHEADLQALEQAILKLPEGQAVCIRLFYLERKSYRQVADRTGLPLEHVRSHLQNGRRNLCNILQGHGTLQ